jgi:predicted AAA+ superfamily ATPase
MLRRKVTAKLAEWKKNERRLPLVIRGARQVGKTFSIEDFCAKNYTATVTLNFIEKPTLSAIFAGDLAPEAILKQISLIVPNGGALANGGAVLFLDEIQACPSARTALKFLAGDRRFDVIASGSLLGINYKDVPSFPVGYTEQLEMHSLDFEEFLWACGGADDLLAIIRDYFEQRKPVPKALHEKMISLLREYIVIGGMPRVVNEFIASGDFSTVLRMQRGIVSDYADDIAKYAEGTEKNKARSCLWAIPKNLAKDHKKFQYSVVEKGGTARKFGGSLMWLHDVGIVSFCYNLSHPALPLEGNAIENEFKVYMRDTGLLVAMLEDGSQADIISGKLGIYKGAIYENIIADIFTKSGKKLYYYEKGNRLEIDFFIRLGGEAVAVEVKSAENAKAKSLNTLLTLQDVKSGIKLSSGNIGIVGNVTTLPLYMAQFL